MDVKKQRCMAMKAKGKINNLEKKETKTGKTFWLMEIGGKKFSSFEEPKAREGEVIHFEYVEKNGYLNIKRIYHEQPDYSEPAPKTDTKPAPDWDAKERRMVRMSVLRGLCSAMAGKEEGLNISDLLKAAEKMEEWVYR